MARLKMISWISRIDVDQEKMQWPKKQEKRRGKEGSEIDVKLYYSMKF